MNGIDSNVLVRYIVRDDPKQTAIATRFLERECTSGSPGRVCLIVLCEMVWVLTSYKYARNDIIGVLRQMVQTAELDIEQRDLVRKAIDDYAQGPADFSDYLIGHVNAAADASPTSTFDRKGAKSKLFRLLR